MEESSNDQYSLRSLCSKLVIIRSGSGLQWLIGSPFLSQPLTLTIVSTFRCIHYLHPPDSSSPDFNKEAEELQTLMLKGFSVIGALIVRNEGNAEQIAGEAIDASRKIRELLGSDDFGGEFRLKGLIGAVANPDTHDVKFFVKNSSRLEAVTSVTYEDDGGKFIWERGCLLRCELPLRLPFYAPVNKLSNAEQMYLQAHEAVIAKFRDSQATYVLEMLNESSKDAPGPFILRGKDLDFHTTILNGKQSAHAPDVKPLLCSHFCSQSKSATSSTSVEDADIIQVSVFHNNSENSAKSAVPVAEYLPALEEARLLVVQYKLEVLSYAAKDLPLSSAVSKLIIPGLVDQLNAMKNSILPNLLTQHLQLCPYHYSPPGMLHPVTVIYELSYGETEMKQVEVRRSLHFRLGLPSDRPLLRIVNALSFTKDSMKNNLKQKGSALLKDVHTGLASSGVSGGIVSLVQGSYEYHHYLQDGFDDSGWGCAYRSLQTIISWFRLQHYTSIDVPSHREIQQALVEIGDKDPSFTGSREWIGAIELSFVLDKLLGVSCKVINVRSGSELPEKCRELALHFENQGTPIMIGGGVLAYTLLGIDYNEASGDSAFLILDPHYTGSEDLKKIVNSGWCGWKKAVDSKGKNFFLQDRFYNLLLPQRPNMV